MEKASTSKKKLGTGSKGKPGSHPKLTDPRPLHDENYQKEQLRGVFKYLVTHDYSSPVSITQLQTPGRTEIWSVTSFLLQKVNSCLYVRSFNELVQTAKAVNYPYTPSSGTPAGNLLTTLGFMFWLHDLNRAMEVREETTTPYNSEADQSDLVAQYLINSYGMYMAEHGEGSSQDLRIAERNRLLAAILEQQRKNEQVKATLKAEIADLETSKRECLGQPLEQFDLEIAHLRQSNETYLMDVIAPLDEKRNQAKALVERPQTNEEETMAQENAIESHIEEIDGKCKELSDLYSKLTIELREAGLPETDQRIEKVEDALLEIQESLPDLEYQDLSLRSELELAEEKRDQLLQLLAERKTSKEFETRERVNNLQMTLACLCEKIEDGKTALATQKTEQRKELEAAKQTLRDDIEFIQQRTQILTAF